jgi:hypothetical protein
MSSSLFPFLFSQAHLIDNSSIKNLKPSIGLHVSVAKWATDRKYFHFKDTHNALRRSGATKPAGNNELPMRLMLFLKILLMLNRNSIFSFTRFSSRFSVRCSGIARRRL